MTELVNFDGKTVRSLEYGDYEKIDLVTFEHELGGSVSVDDGDKICNYSLDGHLINGLHYTTLMVDHNYTPKLSLSAWVDAVTIHMDWSRIRENNYEGVYWNEDGQLKAINGTDGADTDQFEYTLLHESNRLWGITLLVGRYNADGVRIGGQEVDLRIPVEQDNDLTTFSNTCVIISPTGPTISITSNHTDDEDSVHDSYLDELDPVDIDPSPLRGLEHDLDLIDIDTLMNTTENQYSIYNDNW